MTAHRAVAIDFETRFAADPFDMLRAGSAAATTVELMHRKRLTMLERKGEMGS